MFRLLSLVLLFALPPAIYADEAIIVSTPSSPDKKIVAQGNNQFALELYQQLKKQDGNLFLSPASISTALAMVYAGANADTAVEMARTLHFTLPQVQLHPAMAALLKDLNTQGKAHGYKLAVSNAVWLQRGYTLQNTFRSIIQNNYHAGLNELDFLGNTEGARTTINKWVAGQTNNKILDLIPPGGVGQLTRMVLTNAVYFKGSWSVPFEKNATKEENFYPGQQPSHIVSMMHRSGGFKYFDEGTFKALEIPYEKNDLSMIVLLPNDVTGLSALEEKMTPTQMAEWLSGLHPQQEVALTLPKFKLESSFGLADTLKAMGMELAFGSSADFSGITGHRELFISSVIHKAYADVNEEGTEAAAATGIVMRTSAVMIKPAEPVIFRADHPFIFLIRDNASGSILFMGRMKDPA